MNDKEIRKSVLLNIILKPVSVILGLLYMPILLRYLGPEKYGIWVTILSIVNWITTFDIGIGNGLRNCLATELVNEQYDEAKKSVSTAYVILSAIVFTIFLCVLLIGSFLNWNHILNTQVNIRKTLLISFTFVCLNFILSIQNNCYYAIQRSEIVSLINVVIQALDLIGVLLIINFSSHYGSLVQLAFVIGGIGLIVNVCFTLNLWKRKQYFCPIIGAFDRTKLNNICSLGIKFFFIQIAGMVLFTTDSLIISNIFSPSEVTPYNTVYKVFGVGMSLFTALLTPFWSRFTVAKEQGDYMWMQKTINKIKIVWMECSMMFIIAIPFFKPVVNIWLGRELNYENGLVFCMAVYYIAYMYSGIYSTALNGLGDIDLQLLLAIVSTILNVPLSIFLAKKMELGTTGVCLGTVISLLIGNVAFTIQMKGIISRGIQKGKIE